MTRWPTHQEWAMLHLLRHYRRPRIVGSFSYDARSHKPPLFRLLDATCDGYLIVVDCEPTVRDDIRESVVFPDHVFSFALKYRIWYPGMFQRKEDADASR